MTVKALTVDVPVLWGRPAGAYFNNDKMTEPAEDYLPYRSIPTSSICGRFIH